MEQKEAAVLLKRMLRDQLCCLGRVFARHRVPDDVIWEVVKGFDLIYQRTRRQIEDGENATGGGSETHRMEPHPGLIYLLEKVER